LFDGTIGRWFRWFRVPANGWWVHLRYYLLLGVMMCALCGVLISGFVSAIPVITRGMMFLGEPLQSGWVRGWHQVPPMGTVHYVSLLLFLTVLALGLLKPRFWCRYLCPSGAIFSLGNLLRLSERKVESSCSHCNRCVEICPFDAIKADFTTRVTDCTLCQTCAGVCPTHSIKFVERWNAIGLKAPCDPPTGDTVVGRRGFLSWGIGAGVATIGGTGFALATKAFADRPASTASGLPVRPPGSVPEREFLQMCIRCGECFKVCPSNVLQSMGLERGWESMWTPYVHADWAGCEPSCNACGQVCPTAAIRPLPIVEKSVARMGLAVVDEATCLPFAAVDDCQICVDECSDAGYDAIEFTHANTQMDDQGQPIDGTGYLAPVVRADKCVGCGLCQTRCYYVNVKHEKLLHRSAIVIQAGPGKEDRLLSGSYCELRETEARQREAERQQRLQPGTEPTPLRDTDPPPPSQDDDDPFGIGVPPSG